MRKFLLIIFKSVSDFLRETRIYKIIPFRKELYNLIFQTIWPYGEILEIQGSKMYVNIHDKNPAIRETFQAYAINQIHEPATTSLFKKIVKKGDVVVDLGANIGYFTLLAANLTGKEGRIYCFEPEPKNYSYLLKNIKLNNYANVSANQKAVSDKNGKTRLYICEHDTGHHTINQYEGIKNYKPNIENKENFVEIETVTLDNYLERKERAVDVIKIDVEGAEMLALLGMDGIIRKSKNLKMFIEFFPLLIKSMGSSPEDFVRKLLNDYSFSIFIIPDDYNASNEKMIKINSVEELMSFCQGEKDHINLFLEKL